MKEPKVEEETKEEVEVVNGENWGDNYFAGQENLFETTTQE